MSINHPKQTYWVLNLQMSLFWTLSSFSSQHAYVWCMSLTKSFAIYAIHYMSLLKTSVWSRPHDCHGWYMRRQPHKYNSQTIRNNITSPHAHPIFYATQILIAIKYHNLLMFNTHINYNIQPGNQETKPQGWTLQQDAQTNSIKGTNNHQKLNPTYIGSSTNTLNIATLITYHPTIII